MTYIAEIKDIPYDKKRADVVLSDGEICRAFKATIKEYGLVEGKNINASQRKAKNTSLSRRQSTACRAG